MGLNRVRIMRWWVERSKVDNVGPTPFSWVLNLALTRLLEVVGEAATRVPESYQQKYPGLPWAPMIGLRNRLIHGYDQVDLEIFYGRSFLRTCHA
jgi:hypothetical protein